MSEGAVLALAYAVPSLAALVLSFRARSAIARHVLRWPALVSLIVAGLVALAVLDCQKLEFTFGACQRLPDRFGDTMGILQILYVITYVSLGPLLLLAAGIAEGLWHRRNRS
jgi:hypothetical protein